MYTYPGLTKLQNGYVLFIGWIADLFSSIGSRLYGHTNNRIDQWCQCDKCLDRVQKGITYRPVRPKTRFTRVLIGAAIGFLLAMVLWPFLGWQVVFVVIVACWTLSMLLDRWNLLR